MVKKIVLSLLLIAGLISIKVAYDLFVDVSANKILKEHYAEINRVNYELFNIQLWKEQAFVIFRKKIRAFNISQEAYDALDNQIRVYLKKMYQEYLVSGKLIDIVADNLEQGGTINPMFLNVIRTNLSDQLSKLNLESRIPGLSSQIIDEIRANEPMFKGYLQQELIRMLADDISQRYLDRRRLIYSFYEQPGLSETETFLEEKIASKQSLITRHITLLIILTLSIALMAFLGKNVIGFHAQISTLTLVSILWLVLGISLPMITIDARLNSFSFSLLDEPISFDEQVIYYQSKSILEVTQTLWRSGGIDLKLVGVLVFLFSIVFPFFKLVLSAFYLFERKIRESTLAQNVIFHLGKWSMADVFVVAMFMAYIGLYGLIASQLDSISQNQGGFDIETINYSSLAPGALFFTAYTLLSVFIGVLINRQALQPGKP